MQVIMINFDKYIETRDISF